MAKEDVNIKVSANVAEAIRLWKAMETGPAGMAREIDAMANKGKSAVGGMNSELDRMVGKWATIAAKLQAVRGMWNEFTAFNTADRAKTDMASMALDVSSRRFQVQAGLGDSAMAGIRQQILQVAKERGVGIEAAFSTGQQLLSSGFKVQDVVQGGALNAALQVANAVNATGKGFNPTEFAASLGGYLEGTGQAKTAANVQGLGRQLYGLYMGTNLQPGDLAQLAPKAAAIQGMTGMSQSDLLAYYSQFRGVTDAASAATAMRSGFVSQATIAANPVKVRALAELGLAPGDVDFAGESPLQVQERMTRGFAGAATQDRSRIATQLYGQEGLLFYTTLLNQGGMARARERMGMTSDAAAFARSAGIKEGGLEAEVARGEVEVAEAYGTGEVPSATVKERFLAKLKNEGAWTATRMIASWGYDKGIGAGMSPSEAVEFAMPGYAPWRTVGSPGEAEEIQRGATGRTEPAPVQVNVNVTLTDQNQAAIPHRSEVHGLSKSAKPVGPGRRAGR